MGVANSFRKPFIFTKDGHQWCTKLISRPLMWEPSWSWSVISMMEPYRSRFVESYSCLVSKPMIFNRFWISALPVTCLKFASLTFSTLPLSGKTPYLSRPTTLRPATARDLAESPSVKINVQSCEFLPPASLASSNFGMPRTLVTFFATFSWRPKSTFCFARAQSRMRSTMPLFITCLIVFSDNSQAEPNLLCFSVSVSFVWESNVGFTMSALTKTHR
mmetsp:Transcript_9905/g.27631  ORF Transcript_9905/g.27631 Transcript_9905/m.27631 type:complete len:218 (+) Transcript_9905:2931-3584(+)